MTLTETNTTEFGIDYWLANHACGSPGIINQFLPRVAAMKAAMEDVENGPRYLHGCEEGEEALCEEIQKWLNVVDETDPESFCENNSELMQALNDGLDMIEKSEGRKLDSFEEIVAIRFRLMKTFEGFHYI